MSKHISRRSLVIFGILLVVGILGSCLVANQLLFHRCLWWECAPKRDFTVFDLNLPPDLFPSEADIHDLDFLRGDNVSIESASTTNYWENGVAIYIVRRFATDEQALRHYDFDAQVKFTRRSNENSNVVNYKSIEANNSSTQCGYVLNDFRCIYIARYEEFTIFFSGSIGENEMSKHDFLQVIMYIDDRIKSLLKQYLRQLCSRNWFKSGMNHAQTGNLLENLS